MTVWLDVDSVRDICYELAINMPWNGQEPIPAFNTRYRGKLEACLAAPQQCFGGEILYPTLYDQAAILFYLLNKDHPFVNGNKRIALTSLIVFLAVNGSWLNVGDLDYLYKIAVYVAGSPAKDKDEVVRITRSFLRTYCVPINLRDILNNFPKRSF
ncbi:MAG TPA: type II toxin-antitoxin system death-on-curing family toxin [Candidatus Binatia bacterium]|jgi:death-on-curing family protein